MQKNDQANSCAKGFTLIECVIAIGLVGLLLAGVVAVLAPAADDIDEAIVRSESSRILGTLEATMTHYNSQSSYDVAQTYASGFDKVLHWVNNSDVKETAILVYNYHASVEDTDANGYLDPININSGSVTPGIDYTTVCMARRLNDPQIQNELVEGVVQGKVFLVKFKAYTVSGKNIILPAASSSYGGAVEQEGSIITQAEIYRLPHREYAKINSSLDIANYNSVRISKTTILPIVKVNMPFSR